MNYDYLSGEPFGSRESKALQGEYSDPAITCLGTYRRDRELHTHARGCASDLVRGSRTLERTWVSSRMRVATSLVILHKAILSSMHSTLFIKLLLCARHTEGEMSRPIWFQPTWSSKFCCRNRFHRLRWKKGKNNNSAQGVFTVCSHFHCMNRKTWKAVWINRDIEAWGNGLIAMHFSPF